MTCSLSYASILNQRGHRATSQRLTILHVLKSHPGHHTAREIYALTQPLLPALTESTVYRTLEFLARQGLVSPFLDADGNVAYELSDQPHHHLICRQCGKEIEISDQDLQALYQHLEAKTGFRIESSSHVTFFGTCAECRDSLRRTTALQLSPG